MTGPKGLTSEQYRRRVAVEMSEEVLQQRVLALAVVLGWLPYHTHDSRRSHPGFPDLVLVSLRGHGVLWRELKRQTGRVSPAQESWLAALADAGQDVGVWRPADLLEGRVEAVLRGEEVRPDG